MVKLKPTDLTGITKVISAAAQAAVAAYMIDSKKIEVVTKVNYNSLNYSDLQPEGQVFTIQMAVEVHENTKKAE